MAEINVMVVTTDWKFLKGKLFNYRRGADSKTVTAEFCIGDDIYMLKRKPSPFDIDIHPNPIIESNYFRLNRPSGNWTLIDSIQEICFYEDGYEDDAEEVLKKRLLKG